MPDNVVKFHPVEVGAGYKIDTDEMLEATKGTKFNKLVILGDQEDGELYVAGSANAGETLILLHQAINRIVTGQ